jgi:hypothetical protein
MGTLLDPLLESRLEAICQRGCRETRAAITQLEQGGELTETADLMPRDRARLLAELKAIMAVYGDRCRVD